MRDALSILDKIVSFTNGELSYRNTVEHLNILDADYYFRILEAMQQQDLSEALLIYDDINRKGFEGDLVLNGLAEFIRNLLVCKDEKVASLLDAVEMLQGAPVAAQSPCHGLSGNRATSHRHSGHPAGAPPQPPPAGQLRHRPIVDLSPTPGDTVRRRRPGSWPVSSHAHHAALTPHRAP